MTGMQVIENGRIVDSSSIVPVMTVNNVTSDRAFSVLYTNTTERTLFIMVSCQCVKTTTDGRAHFSIILDGTTMTGRTGIYLFPGSFNGSFMLCAIIKPGQTYMAVPVVTGDGYIEINSWIEVW